MIRLLQVAVCPNNRGAESSLSSLLRPLTSSPIQSSGILIFLSKQNIGLPSIDGGGFADFTISISDGPNSTKSVHFSSRAWKRRLLNSIGLTRYLTFGSYISHQLSIVFSDRPFGVSVSKAVFLEVAPIFTSSNRKFGVSHGASSSCIGSRLRV